MISCAISHHLVSECLSPLHLIVCRSGWCYTGEIALTAVPLLPGMLSFLRACPARPVPMPALPGQAAAPCSLDGSESGCFF